MLLFLFFVLFCNFSNLNQFTILQQNKHIGMSCRISGSLCASSGLSTERFSSTVNEAVSALPTTDTCFLGFATQLPVNCCGENLKHIVSVPKQFLI